MDFLFVVCGLSSPVQDFQGDVPVPSFPKIQQLLEVVKCDLMPQILNTWFRPSGMSWFDVQRLLQRHAMLWIQNDAKGVRSFQVPILFMHIWFSFFLAHLRFPSFSRFQGSIGIRRGCWWELHMHIYIYIRLLHIKLITYSQAAWGVIVPRCTIETLFSMPMLLWFCHFSNTTMTKSDGSSSSFQFLIII